MFGYFFGPFDDLPSDRSTENLQVDDAVCSLQFGDLHLIEEKWPVIRESEPWNREAWPLPPFVRVDHFEGKAWKVIYSEDTLTEVSQERCDLSLAEQYPEDGLDGAGAVEIVLTKLLTEEEGGLTQAPEEPPVQSSAERAGAAGDVPAAATIVESLLNDLEQIYETHGEVTDTGVRESVHLTLSYFFVWGKEGELPVSYRMFSAEGDRAVADAVERFLTAARATPELSAVPVGRARLELLQNEEISTPGGLMYDDFLGHVDDPLPPDPLPRELYEVPDYE